jgi:hypothetical protein
MLIGVAALLLGVVLLFAVPIDVAFVVRREEKLEGRVTVGWLFGLVRIPVAPASSPSPAVTPHPVERKRAKRRPGKRRTRHVWSMLRTEGFPGRVFRLLRRLLARVHIRRLHLQVRLGLDDPADTGRVWGVIGPLICTAPTPKGSSVAIEPDFTGEAFHVIGEGAVRIVPIEIIATVLAFALSPVTWRALRALGTGK